MPVYGLRYRPLGQTLYYTGVPGFVQGDYVLIEMEQGQALAHVVSGPFDHVSGYDEDHLPAILSRAAPEDIHRGEVNTQLSREAFSFCRTCIRRRKMDMHLVDVEVFFDRSKFIFYFTAPSRIDFRDLVKDLVRQYHVRIELRQIGVRHETQMLGAMGNCGMTCCCRRYLRTFAPVTIRMAKEQNLFLNPAKISGICGRLLCCLAYEQENYDHFQAACPRVGKRYQTDKGWMKVLRANMFHNTVSALTESNEEVVLQLEEWQALSPHRPETASHDGCRPSAFPEADTVFSEQAPEDLDALKDILQETEEQDSLMSETAPPAGENQAQAEGHQLVRRKRRHKQAH